MLDFSSQHQQRIVALVENVYRFQVADLLVSGKMQPQIHQ